MIFIKTLVFFVFMLNYNSVDHAVSGYSEEMDDEQDICIPLLNNYAKASANFTFCAVTNARPIKIREIRICEQCVEFYRDVEIAHENILKVEDGSGHKKCKDQLMNLDRLEVIEGGFTFIKDLWNRAACSACFETKNNTFVLANSTINFMAMQNTTQECFERHKDSNETYSKNVCVECEKNYCDMNKFYDELKNSQENICMDIVDSMNVTRMMWNDKLKCKLKVQEFDVIFLASSATIAALPILFYLGAKLFSTVTRNRLQIQKRLAEVLRPSTSGGT